MRGIGFDIGPRSIGRLLRNPSGIAKMLSMEHPETGESPAEIMADVINLMRAVRSDSRRSTASTERSAS